MTIISDFADKIADLKYLVSYKIDEALDNWYDAGLADMYHDLRRDADGYISVDYLIPNKFKAFLEILEYRFMWDVRFRFELPLRLWLIKKLYKGLDFVGDFVTVEFNEDDL
jgi:hypothetical protein